MTSASPAAEGVAVEKGGVRTVLYEPLPHQKRFHASTKPYCLMEGSRGGGKSLAIRWDAYMRCLSVPRFSALVVRRTMPELRLTHLGEVPFEAKALGLADDAWHSTFNILRFPNGSRLEFGHVEDEQSLPRYLSSQYDAIYFDELATFTERQFFFLASSARTKKVGIVQPIVRAGTNPVGIGAQWVKRCFIDKSIPKSEDYDPDEYESIHSTMDDNHHLDRKDYDKRLRALPSEALRRALRYGEWVVEGQFFSEWDPKRHVLQTPPMYRGAPIWEAPHIEIVRVLDWGYSAAGNPGVCLWFACLTDGTAICFQEYYFKETLPRDVAAEIKKRSAGLRVRYTVGDTAMWQEHEGPSIAEQLSKHGLGMIEADKERVPGWVEVHTHLRDTVTYIINDQAVEVPKLRFMATCERAVRTIPEMVVDPKDANDIQTTNVEDDASDCVRYFVMSRPGRSKATKEDPAATWIKKQIAKKKRTEGRLGSNNVRRRAA